MFRYLQKNYSSSQSLSIAPDTRLPQILVFKLFSARHTCNKIYPKEYVLHAQGINVSDAYSDNAFSLFFLHVDFSMIISAAQSMIIKCHSGGGCSEDKRLTLTSVGRGADSLDSGAPEREERQRRTMCKKIW